MIEKAVCPGDGTDKDRKIGDGAHHPGSSAHHWRPIGGILPKAEMPFVAVGEFGAGRLA